jgi:hypothetical protein
MIRGIRLLQYPQILHEKTGELREKQVPLGPKRLFLLEIAEVYVTP